MKKIIYLALIIVLSLSLSACDLNALLNSLTVTTYETEETTKKEKTTTTENEENDTTTREVITTKGTDTETEDITTEGVTTEPVTEETTKEDVTTKENITTEEITEKEKTQLSIPETTITDDGIFTFYAVENAVGYVVRIYDGDEYLDVEYTTSKTFELHEKEVIQVMAVGDGENYTDSEWSLKASFLKTKLDAPVLTENYGDYTWNTVNCATSYTYKVNDTEYTVSSPVTVRLCPNDKICVKANANNTKLSSDYSDTLTLTIPFIEIVVTMDDDGYASFTTNGYVTDYEYMIDSDSSDLKYTTETTLRVEDKKTITVRGLYKATETQYYYVTDWSNTVTSSWKNIDTVVTLSAPDVTMEYGKISWEAIENVQYYEYKYLGSDTTYTTLLTEITPVENQPGLYIRSYGYEGYYETSEWAGPYYYTYLTTPQVRIYNGVASWNAITNSLYYEYSINGGETKTTTSREVNLSLNDTITVRACSKYYIDSKYSSIDKYTSSYKLLTRAEVDKLNNHMYYNYILPNFSNWSNMKLVYDIMENKAYEFYQKEADAPSDLIVMQIDYSSYSVTDAQIVLLYEAFLYEHQFYYWVSNSYSYGSYFTMYIDSDYSSFSVRKQYEEEILNQLYSYEYMVKDASSDYEKALIIHDAIMNDMYYEYVNGSPSMTSYAHNILGLMHNGSGVCESYAESYALIMNYLGVETIEIAGSANGGGHAWNMIKIDGEWYLCDLTWDDDYNHYNYTYVYFLDPQYVANESGYTFAYEHRADASFTYPSTATTKYTK